MRRLVVEISADQFQREEDQAIPQGVLDLRKVKSLEMLHILRMAPGEVAAVVRIELKDPTVRVEEILGMEGSLQDVKLETELLEKESETVFTYFMRINRVRPSPSQIGLGSMPYFSPPLEYKDGKLRLGVLGSSAQIRRYLAIVSQSKIKCRVVSLTDAKFPPNSSIGRLTDKQRRVLLTAYKLGYYDVPRRITAEKLARKLSLVKSTFSAHVRKAERRLLAEMLSEL